MAKKKQKKNLTKGVFKELGRRGSSEAASRQEFLKSDLLIRLEGLIPERLRWLFPFISDFRPALEEDEEEAALDKPTEVAEALRRSQFVEPLYLNYPCQQSNPLNCDRLQQADQKIPEVKYCQECGFPALLLEKAEIRGIRGRYRVENILSSRGIGRLYQGIQISDNQRVVIKEYLLPGRYFNPEEATVRKQAFVRLGGVSLADGRVQDFRLSHPWEAIADANEERCYLVTKGKLDLDLTLGEYLLRHGAMTGSAVRQVLNQVLQTLEFLHGQKYRFPSGQVQSGLVHGNLNLSSLLIDEQEFFIYVCDLALWERLFDPSTSEIIKPLPSQDLVALGYVGFYLLAGSTHNPVDRQPLDPKNEQQWPPVNFALKAFLLRLMGLGIPFESAEAARQALLKLPPEAAIAGVVVQGVPEEEEQIKKTRPLFLFLLLGTLGLMLLGILIWFLIPKANEPSIAGDELPLRYIKDVSAIPSGKFTYTGEVGGRWTDLQIQKNLVAPGKTLPGELTARQPKLQLIYQPEPSDNQAIQKVISGEKDFAVTSLVNSLPVELEYKEIAYDGLVVVVAFSYSQREKSLPSALKGQITFEQLQKLYTGEITNWKDLGGPDLLVKLYMPDDTEAVRIFEQQVLKDSEKINAFRNLQRKEEAALVTNSWMRVVTRVANSREMLQKVIQDFEKADAKKQVGSITFSRLSQVFGQCSVYPLALVEGENSPVQPLIQDGGQPVNPTTDLCNDKGSYHPNFQVFKDRIYPLAYPLAVVYPRDNSRPPVGAKFADMLRTQEGQQLLGKTGLVPLYSLTPIR